MQLLRNLQQIERHKLVIGGLSLFVTLLIATGFLIESRYGYLKPDPVMIYVKTWPAGRTEADALADQKKLLLVQRQEIRDAIAKVDKHTNDADKLRLKKMAASNAQAIARLHADQP